MKILTTNINAFSFDDVVAFCKEGKPEGIELDYKKDYPPKGLQKHFASFANTRGGAIIIGVEEDKKSGKPVKYEGVSDNAKLIERIYQEASNVTPLLPLIAHKTNKDKNGNVFILIRILEGDNTPYYVQNDSNIWIRTGNISNPIDISSPEWTELLVGKQSKAIKSRGNYLKMASLVYEQALKREEKKRQRLIGEAKAKGDGSEKSYYQKPLGTEVGMCELTIQPFYPRKALTKPKEMMDQYDEYVFEKASGGRFPDRNLESIPQGLLHFKHNYDGFIECQQIYAHGLVYNKLDVMRTDQQTGRQIVLLAFLAGRIYVVLKAASNIYQKYGYQGSLEFRISLEDVGEMHFREIKPNGFMFWNDDKESLMKDYSWEYDLDTRVLSNDDEFKTFYKKVLEEVYWSLGIQNFSDKVIDKFMEQNKLN